MQDFTRGEVLVLGHDDRIAGNRVIPNRTVFRIDQPHISNMFSRMSRLYQVPGKGRRKLGVDEELHVHSGNLQDGMIGLCGGVLQGCSDVFRLQIGEIG